MIGEQCLVSRMLSHAIVIFTPLLETMASHRAQLLSTLLPNALAFGFQEIHPEREPLKVTHK